jgi:hypothetical protein
MKLTTVIPTTIALALCCLPTVATSGDGGLFWHGRNSNTEQVKWKSYRPWTEPMDTYTALNSPDIYAWQLFVALNWPVSPGSCKPDRGKALGDPGLTTWESWISREQVFLPNAAKPEKWIDNCRSGAYESLPVGSYSTIYDETVKMNSPTYNYIRDNRLYSLDEQERLAKAGVRDIKFPIGSKEIKAYWVVISEADKPRYHWTETEREGQKVIFGLTALHIMSKDTPTWFWSTFEHVDNEHIWSSVYPDAFRGWPVPSKDSAGCPEDDLACNKIPAGFGLEGTKWENYRLRGTQINWVDNRGNPTILTNSQIEGSQDQQSMSCITCHALAVKGVSGDAIPIPFLSDTVNDEGFPYGYVGALNPELFNDENGEPIPYLGLDYVWTLLHAQRE